MQSPCKKLDCKARVHKLVYTALVQSSCAKPVCKDRAQSSCAKVVYKEKILPKELLSRASVLSSCAKAVYNALVQQLVYKARVQSSCTRMKKLEPFSLIGEEGTKKKARVQSSCTKLVCKARVQTRVQSSCTKKRAFLKS